MLAAGEMRALPPGEQLSALWPRVWALADDDGSKAPPSDGTEVRRRASSWRPALAAHPERRPCAGVVARLAVRRGAGPTRRAAARGDCGRGARGVALVVREGSTLGPAVNDDRERGELAREICVTFCEVEVVNRS